MAAWEAVLVALTSLIVGAAIATATLVPILRGTLRTGTPYLPLPMAACIVGSTLVLTLTSIGVPVHLALRHRPTETLKTT
jgi:putative ABC transport system permease protein